MTTHSLDHGRKQRSTALMASKSPNLLLQSGSCKLGQANWVNMT